MSTANYSTTTRTIRPRFMLALAALGFVRRVGRTAGVGRALSAQRVVTPVASWRPNDNVVLR